MKNSDRSTLLIVVAILIVAFLVIWAVYFMKPASSIPSTADTSSNVPAVTTASTVQPVYAASGQVAPGFPTNLILGPAQISESYSISYSANNNQYTAVWEASSSMAALFTQYKTYLTSNGWVISHETTTYSTSRGIYAVKGTSSVNVAIISQPQNTSQVTVTYVGG